MSPPGAAAWQRRPGQAGPGHPCCPASAGPCACRSGPSSARCRCCRQCSPALSRSNVSMLALSASSASWRTPSPVEVLTPDPSGSPPALPGAGASVLGVSAPGCGSEALPNPPAPGRPAPRAPGLPAGATALCVSVMRQDGGLRWWAAFSTTWIWANPIVWEAPLASARCAAPVRARVETVCRLPCHVRQSMLSSETGNRPLVLPHGRRLSVRDGRFRLLRALDGCGHVVEGVGGGQRSPPRRSLAKDRPSCRTCRSAPPAARRS